MKWKEGKSYRFVLHLHLAKRAGRHYDLRIERDDNNVESFATKKEIIKLKKGDRIQLFRQPLHTPDWLDFEGEITDGYGQGKITIVDKGKVTLLRQKDNRVFVFEFKGKKLKGLYALIRLGKDDWLFVRMKKSKKDEVSGK
jgi:hypothetical protein